MTTKLDSLKQHISSGAAANQRQRVLLCLTSANAFGLDGLSREDVEQVANLRTSSACARLNELEAVGAIAVHGTKLSPTTGKTVQTYRAVLAQ